jgi:hypothetical protein
MLREILLLIVIGSLGAHLDFFPLLGKTEAVGRGFSRPTSFEKEISFIGARSEIECSRGSSEERSLDEELRVEVAHEKRWLALPPPQLG